MVMLENPLDLLKIAIFVVVMLPAVYQNLSLGIISNRTNGIIFAAGVATFVLLPYLAGQETSLLSYGYWLLFCVGLMVIWGVMRKGVGAGSIKLLIALIPWFAWGEFLMVVMVGSALIFLLSTMRGVSIGAALPMFVAGLVVMVVV